MPVVPMFPLGSVLFPGETLSLHVFEPRYVQMLRECVLGTADPEMGVVLIERGSEVGGRDERTDVGTLARIESLGAVTNSRFLLQCVGRQRIAVERWLPDDPYPRAEVHAWPDEVAPVPSELTLSVLDLAAELADLARRIGERSGRSVALDPLPDVADLPADPSERSYVLAAALPLGPADRHAVLRCPDPAARLARLAEALGDLIAVLRFQLLE